MNIGKSIQIALIKKEMSKKELATALSIQPAYVTLICHRPTCSQEMMGKLCNVFNMKASELVALGE